VTPRRILVSCALALSLGATGCGRYGTAFAAVVNGHRISFAALQAEVLAVRGPQVKGTAPIEVQRQALLTLIRRELIDEQLRLLKLTVSDSDVKAAVARVRAGFPSAQAFDQALTGQGLNEATFEGRVRDTLGQQKVQTEVVPVTVTDAELRDAYKSQIAQVMRVHARHILFSTQGKPDATQLARARDTVAKLRAGADFAALAKQLSDDPGSKTHGGDLGTQPAAQYVEEFAKAVETLKVNAISDPVKTQFGYHVIQVLSRTTTPFADVKESIRSSIIQQKTQAPFQQYVSRIVSSSTIEVNPRIGDLDPTTFTIVDHKFFIQSSPEESVNPLGGNPLGGNPLGDNAGVPSSVAP
jgi:parvulin-like peptidyl-prolyl isomerase